MSTFVAADLGDSSDEEDLDFVPVPIDPSKKRKATADSVKSPEEKTAKEGDEEAVAAASKRKKAADVFDAMKEESAATGETSTSSSKAALVEVKRLRRFAGENLECAQREARFSDADPQDSRETVQVPSNDPEAVAYLARLDKIQPIQSDEAHNLSLSSESLAPIPRSGTSSMTEPSRRSLTKRKPRQSLEQMSAALDKGKKMTTLEKVSTAIVCKARSLGLADDAVTVTARLEETHVRCRGSR